MKLVAKHVESQTDYGEGSGCGLVVAAGERAVVPVVEVVGLVAAVAAESAAGEDTFEENDSRTWVTGNEHAWACVC